MSTGWFQIARSASDWLIGAQSNDVMLRTEDASQRVLVGCGNNVAAAFTNEEALVPVTLRTRDAMASNITRAT